VNKRGRKGPTNGSTPWQFDDDDNNNDDNDNAELRVLWRE
jgi:hypothetical protein